jgi:hypothetical protein
MGACENDEAEQHDGYPGLIATPSIAMPSAGYKLRVVGLLLHTGQPVARPGSRS